MPDENVKKFFDEVSEMLFEQRTKEIQEEFLRKREQKKCEWDEVYEKRKKKKVWPPKKDRY